MNKWLELLLGIILIIIPIIIAMSWSSWGQATLQFIQGGIVVGVILIGLLLVILGISDITG